MAWLSIPARPSDILRERALLSAVSDSMFEDFGGTKKKEKLDGVYWRSQKNTPVLMAVSIPAGI